MDHLHIPLAVTVNPHEHELQSKRPTIALQALAEQIGFFTVSYDRRNMPDCRLHLVFYSGLLIYGAKLLFQRTDAPDVLAPVDLGEGDLPYTLARDGEEGDIATEIREDECEAGDAQEGIEDLACPGRAGWNAGHEEGGNEGIHFGRTSV